MRVVEIVQVIGATVGAFGTVAAAVENHMVRRLRNLGATSAEAAVEWPSPGVIERWRLHRLRAAGAIVSADANRLYLDEPSLAALRSSRRKKALSLVALAAALIALAFLVAR